MLAFKHLAIHFHEHFPLQIDLLVCVQVSGLLHKRIKSWCDLQLLTDRVSGVLQTLTCWLYDLCLPTFVGSQEAHLCLRVIFEAQ
jgi:hypothetical protein